jgi:outer membrane protein TolC
MSDRLLPAVMAVVALLPAWPAAARNEPPPPAAALSPVAPATLERVTFDEAVRRAVEHHPTVREASQAILRTQALLDQAKAVYRPTLYAGAGTTILDAARGFDGNVTQPRTQTAFNATLSFPFLAASRWAAKNQAADQVAIARISAEEIRRQVAQTAAGAYLAVIAAQRQREIAVRNLDTARALDEYSSARLEAGKGSRLNHVRSTQERALAEGRLQSAELFVRRAQEALGVAIFADGAVDANGDPELHPAPPPLNDAWLLQRPDIRLFTAQEQAADRVVRNSWTSWFPTGIVAFTPQYVTPAGFFAPAKTWSTVFQLQIPIYDGSLGATKRLHIADRETARIRVEAVKAQARAELRLAQESVTRTEQIVTTSRLAAESASEALRITEIAYRAGATSNIEVVQAQQGARNAETELAVAEDRLRQARLDLLLALGQFPQ